MAEQIPCSQLGCTRSFTRNADRTKHIRNHHLSRLNIQPIIARPHSSSPLPRRAIPSNSSSPRDNLEIPISPNHREIPTSPNRDMLTPPNHNMSPDPIDHPTPDPDPEPPPPRSVPPLPPEITRVFHPTINGKLSSL